MPKARAHDWVRLSFVAAMLALGAAGLPPSAAWASPCEPTDKIDGSTVETARKKIENAGYRQVRNLKKGCDNFWHGSAVKDGKAVNIVLSPQGNVMVDGD
jgi:hypothetical protein